MSEILLQSQRLHLAPFNRNEAALFHEINTTAHIRKYLWDDELIPLSLAEDIMQKNHQHFEQDSYGLWKICLQEEVIGYAGLWYFFEEAQPQLLYAILEQFTGKGFATEAASLILDYVFNSLGFSYLRAAIDDGHEASQNVVNRLGMQFLERRIEEGKPTLFYEIKNPLHAIPES